MPTLPGRGCSLEVAATAGRVGQPNTCTGPFMERNWKQISTGTSVWDTGPTGIVTEPSAHPAEWAPRVTTRESRSTCTVTLGPSTASTARRIADVSRGSVSPAWRALTGLAVY
jgi:hypothetical protein